jgi:hypothetical protein
LERPRHFSPLTMIPQDLVRAARCLHKGLGAAHEPNKIALLRDVRADAIEGVGACGALSNRFCRMI